MTFAQTAIGSKDITSAMIFADVRVRTKDM
jgi:hypothetical protein